MFKTLTMIAALLIPGVAHAANSISLSDCSSGSAKVSYTLDNDDTIVIWDGSSASNSITIPVNATGVTSAIVQDFASEWGGSSNASVEAYFFSASNVTASCSD